MKDPYIPLFGNVEWGIKIKEYKEHLSQLYRIDDIPSIQEEYRNQFFILKNFLREDWLVVLEGYKDVVRAAGFLCLRDSWRHDAPVNEKWRFYLNHDNWDGSGYMKHRDYPPSIAPFCFPELKKYFRKEVHERDREYEGRQIFFHKVVEELKNALLRKYPNGDYAHGERFILVGGTGPLREAKYRHADYIMPKSNNNTHDLIEIEIEKNSKNPFSLSFIYRHEIYYHTSLYNTEKYDIFKTQEEKEHEREFHERMKKVEEEQYLRRQRIEHKLRDDIDNI